jgi:hypothetical protein
VDPVPNPLLLRKSGSAGNRTQSLWICSGQISPEKFLSDMPHKVATIQHSVVLYVTKPYSIETIVFTSKTLQ